MNCKNCGHIVQDTYCGHCGQKVNVDRITFSSLLNELTESVFQVNRGFFYTLINLFVSPGKSIREYLEGHRKKHFKPIAYLLTFSTVYFIVTQLSGQHTWMDDLISGFAQGGSGKEEIPAILNWFAKNYAYTTLLLLPVFSFASFLSFLGLEKNYFEHLVINSYATGQQAIIYSIFALLKINFSGELLEVLPLVIAVSYTFWVYWQVFDQGNRLIVVMRSVLTYVLHLILSFGILILLLGITEIIK